MRDVNQPARSRSHHRQRTALGATATGVAPAMPTRRPPEPRSTNRTEPAATFARGVGRRRGVPAESCTSQARSSDPTDRARVDRTSAPSRASSSSERQAFRKRAVSQHQSRIYKAGQSSRRLVAVFVIAALLFLAVLARVTLLQTVQADELRSGRQVATNDRAATEGSPWHDLRPRRRRPRAVGAGADDHGQSEAGARSGRAPFAR